MDFDRDWTQFAMDAEIETYGLARIAKAHNDLRAEVARLERENLHWGLWAESIGCTTDDDGNWVDQNGEYIPKVKGE